MRGNTSKEHRCKDYIHCDSDNLKCYPQSKDCRSEYDLTIEDIEKYTNDRCDFYREKKEVN